MSPEADGDIHNIYNNLELIRVGLGLQFVAELRTLLTRIEAMPEIYGVIWKQVRAARIGRFRHVLYYVVYPDRVNVVAVVQGSSDPTRWQARV